MNQPDQIQAAELILDVASRRAEEAKANGLSLKSLLLSPTYRYVLSVGAVVSLLHQVTGINVYIASSNHMLAETGMKGRLTTMFTTLLMFVHFLFTLPALYLIERLGRRQLLLYGIFAMTLSVIPGVISLWIAPDSTLTVALVVSGYGIHVFLLLANIYISTIVIILYQGDQLHDLLFLFLWSRCLGVHL